MSQAGHCVRSAATLTFYAATMVSTIIWWSTPVVVMILGQDYVAVAGLLLPLLLAAIVDCLTGPTVPVMQTMGLEAFYTRAMLCYLPVQICLMAAAGTVWGIQGAAFAFLTARVLWNIAIAVHIYRVQGLCMLPYINVMNAFWPSAEAASKERIAVTITATSTSNSVAYSTSARAA
jgi:O-antigen/teichoic acid export membrane protein